METFQGNNEVLDEITTCNNNFSTITLTSFNDTVQNLKDNYKKKRSDFFEQVYQSQYDQLLGSNSYQIVICIMYGLLKNIIETEDIIKNFEDENNALKTNINQESQNDNKIYLNKLIDEALVRNANSENEKKKLESLNNKLKTYTSVTAFIILFQIFLIFFV